MNVAMSLHGHTLQPQSLVGCAAIAEPLGILRAGVAAGKLKRAEYDRP